MRNFHPNAIRGMFASIAVNYQIPILYSKNRRDTTIMLATITKRLERPLKPISLLTRRKPLTQKEQKLLLLESLPGIGPTIAKLLLNNFKTIKEIINASEEEFKNIEKIGPKKAKEIYDLFNKED